jgi:exosortase
MQQHSQNATVTGRRSPWILVVLLLGSFALLYRDVMGKLIHDWMVDENYSHGFLIIPLAVYFAWQRKERFHETPYQPSLWGLLVVVISIGLLLTGILGSEIFTAEISMLGVIGGAVLFLRGRKALRTMFFPISFLLLMIPIPALVFNEIALPLQLIASNFAEAGLAALRIPALREGNVIHLANTSLEVAEACSGIRSLVSLITLGLVYGYFMDSRLWLRGSLAAAAVPIAIITNGLRVAGTGIAAYYYGPNVALGFFHTFSGWLVFLGAFVIVFIFHRALIYFVPPSLKPAVRLDPKFESTQPKYSWE